MPPIYIINSALSGVATKLPLAAALLSSWDHSGLLLGQLMEEDAVRMDGARVSLGLPSALFI